MLPRLIPPRLASSLSLFLRSMSDAERDVPPAWPRTRSDRLTGPSGRRSRTNRRFAMVAARSLALGSLVLVSLCGTARASDSNLDLALWNYWQGQGPGATVLSNRPLTYSNTTVVAPTTTPTYADAYINLDGT